MKATKDFRPSGDREETLRKAIKLEPVKKSGKERHQMFGQLDDDDVEPDDYRKKESILDYYEDEEEN